MAETERAEIKPELKTMMKKLSAGASYRKMIAAHEAGRPVCMVSGSIPSEVLFAMDVYPVYPESLAAISAGIGKADEFFEEAKLRGFSSTICSYTRCGLGISWTEKCAFGPIPEPALYVTDVSLCCLHVTWWAYLEDHFRKPTFYLDMPAIDDPDDPAYIDYYENQIREMVKFIEDNTDSVFDLERLKETVRYSDLAGHYWRKIMELRKHKPSPPSFRHLAGQILPLVTALGDKDAADFYMAYYPHYEDQMKEGVTPAVGDEKYRLIWNGIPIWHHLQIISEFEKDKPNYQLIQIMAESLGLVEEGIKTSDGPLSMLKEVHEYYMAETEVCELPKLAHQFLEKFIALKDIATDFKATLHKIEHSLN